MKRSSLTLSLVSLFFLSLNAQTEAITANGDTVLLFDDATWDFKSNQTLEEIEEEVEAYVPPALNPEKFSKPQSSKEVAKGKNGAYEIWYDAKKWARKIDKASTETDIELSSKSGEGFVMTIFERVELPLPKLRDAALENARSAGTEIAIVKEEMRAVNGRQVLCLRFNVTIDGVKFTFIGYYCTFQNGTLQVITFTYQNLFDEFEPDFQDLLNGLIVKE